MEVRNFILPENVNEDIEKGLTTNKQAWASFAAAAGLMFGDDVAVAIGAAVSDGALPIGDLIALGIGMAIVVQIFMNYKEIWEKANEIVVTQEPENQVYTTPEAEPETIEHTASVPPEVQTVTPPFDTEAGRYIEQQQHTGNTTQQEVNWDNYIFHQKYEKLTDNQLRKAQKSYEDLIEEHKQKLKDYLANPDAYDNKGILRNASPQLRSKIIQGRANALQKQIKKQENELNKINDELKKRGLTP